MLMRGRGVGLAIASSGLVMVVVGTLHTALAHAATCSFTVIVEAANPANIVATAPGFGCSGECPDPYAPPCMEFPHENRNAEGELVSVTTVCKCNGQWLLSLCRGSFTEGWDFWELNCGGPCGGSACLETLSQPYSDPEFGALRELFCECQ